MTVRIVFFLCLCFISASASAAENALMPSAGEGQIEITADESLEWHQDRGLYVARGNAKVVRGTLTVEADILAAREKKNTVRENAQSDTGAPGGRGIDLLIAEGNVRIFDDRQKVFGDRAEYDLESGVARITGKNLSYVTADDTVTARDTLEYHEKSNTAVARGKAVAVHDKRRVEADVLKARFARDSSGRMEMVEMTAEGNVTVLAGNDVTRGDRVVYDVKNNIAVMTGNVRISRGDTQLSGDRAEVDLARGESRLVNQGRGRVRALLIPKTGDSEVVDSGAETSQKYGSKGKGR